MPHRHVVRLCRRMPLLTTIAVAVLASIAGATVVAQASQPSTAATNSTGTFLSDSTWFSMGLVVMLVSGTAFISRKLALVDARFQAGDVRFAGVDKRLDQHDARDNQADARAVQNELVLALLNAKINAGDDTRDSNLRAAVARRETVSDKLDDRIGHLEHPVPPPPDE